MTCAPTMESAAAAGVVVATVRPRTAAAAAGLAAGDRIVAINGQPLRDVIDFHFHSGDARVRLRVERQLGYKNLKYLSGITVTDSAKDWGKGQGAQGAENGYSWYAGI